MQGVVAKRALKAGTVVVRDKGIFSSPGSTLARAIEAQVPDFRTYTGGDVSAEEVGNLNSFGGAGAEAFFPLISRVNHACEPNAAMVEVGGGEWKVCTVRDVAPGEEITICYMKFIAPDFIRRELIQHTYENR